MNEYNNVFFLLITSIAAILIAINNISNCRLETKDNILMSISIVFTYLFIRYFFPRFATVVIYIVPIFFIYKKSKNIFSSIFIDIFAWVLVIIINDLALSICYVIFRISSVTYNVQFLCTCFIVYTMIYMITKYFGKLYNEYRIFIYKNLTSKYFIFIYIMVIITFGVFYHSINWNKYLDNSYIIVVNSAIELAYGLVMILVCISLLISVRKEEKVKYEKAQLESLKEYIGNLEEMYTEMRKFRHDYINVVSSISAFIEDKDMQGLEEYFNNNIYYLNNKIHKNNYKLGALKNILMQEVKGLISAKVMRAQELGIDVVIDVVEAIDDIKMQKIDLIRSLGIILDNAIEASMESEGKSINIILVKKEKSVVIVVTNTYGNKILPISKMFKAGISTKGENRGLGLSNLKEITGRYANVALDTYIENNIFIQEMEIYSGNEDF